MLALTHLALALFLISVFRMGRHEAYATLLFGVFIDLDHLFGMLEFLVREGWANALNVQAALSSDIQWKSLLHGPEGALFVAPVLLISRWILPLMAWALHLLMDHVQINYLGIASPFEVLILAGMFVGLLLLERQEYTSRTGDLSFTGLAMWEVERVSDFASGLPFVRSIRRWRGPLGTSS